MIRIILSQLTTSRHSVSSVTHYDRAPKDLNFTVSLRIVIEAKGERIQKGKSSRDISNATRFGN